MKLIIPMVSQCIKDIILIMNSMVIKKIILKKKPNKTISHMKKNQYNKDGKRHGYWEAYHSNGKLLSKANYKDGNLHGHHEAYYSNGKLLSKANHKDGNLHGYWEAYYTNGEPMYKGNYIDNEYHGYQEDYTKKNQTKRFHI